MWGLNEEQISSIFLPCGIAALMFFAVFMMAELALKARIGKRATAMLLLAMTLGLSSFTAKVLMQQWLQS